jgi:hypothetical protein
LKRTHRTLAAASLLALATGIAQATVIGFDPLTTDSRDGYAYAPGDRYTEGGFTFTSSGHDGYELLTWASYNPFNADPGGATLAENNDGESLIVTRDGGGSFTLGSFDLADAYNSGKAGTVTMTYTDASGVHTQALDMPTAPGLRTFEFNYTGVTSFSLVQNDPFFQLDNVNLVSSVPEPGPLALMLGGLAAMAFVGRRRRAR